VFVLAMLLVIGCVRFPVDNLTRADIIPVVSEEQSTTAPAADLILINGRLWTGSSHIRGRTLSRHAGTDHRRRFEQ
jgi:hypothetical protein